MELKILAALLYFFGLSLRKTSGYLSLFEEISHESVGIYYHRLKKMVLKQPRKKPRRLIAIDETKIKLEKRPEVVVDRGFWYMWALRRLGLKYRHETFGKKNTVEGFFSRFKERMKKFWNRFPFRSSFDSVQSWLESFMDFYNYWRC